MADEYIRKEDAEDVIAKRSGFETAERAKKWAMMHPIDLEPWFGAVATAITAVESLEPADVVPVRHARWERYSGITIRCSRCEHVIHDWRLSECKYCPNCGAKMDGHREV